MKVSLKEDFPSSWLWGQLSRVRRGWIILACAFAAWLVFGLFGLLIFHLVT